MPPFLEGVAAIKGEFYAFTDFRYVTDAETGERTRKGVSVKVTQWFWQDITGKYFLCIKYGSKKLEFEKGKFAVEGGDQKNIIPTFKKIAEAVYTSSILVRASKSLKSILGKLIPLCGATVLHLPPIINHSLDHELYIFAP